VLLIAAGLSLSAQDSSYRWIRQLGGSDEDKAAGIALDAAGNVYVAGSTLSQDFPLKNAIQERPGSVPLYRIDGLRDATKLYGTGASVITAVAISPCGSRTVYAAAPHTVLRSADLGNTWNSSPLPGGMTANSIAVACGAQLPETVYASSDVGFVRSRDFTDWDYLAAGGGPMYQVWVDPAVPTTIYARTAKGLARSLDGGDHWQLTGATTYSLTFDSVHPGVIYAPLIIFAAGSTIAVSAIVPAKSTDFGATWMQLAALPGRDTYPLVVVPDPSLPGVLYAAGHGLFVSTDAGQTWTLKPLSIGTPFVVDPQTQTVYAVSESGVIATRDRFNTTMSVTPKGLPLINSLAVSGGVAFFGTYASHDVFVTKLDPDGEVVFSTYFGGSGDDTATAIAVGPDGGVYVTGATASLDFPTNPEAFQPAAHAPGAKFLFKLNSDGTLAYSTYFAGLNDYNTTASALAVDVQGSAIVAGTTSGGIPITPRAYQMDFNGMWPAGGGFVPLPSPTNAFAAKFTADGSGLVYSTYLGKQEDSGNALALAPDGSTYIAGWKNLFHLSAGGDKLLGGISTGSQSVYSLAMDAEGSLYAAGPALPAGMQSLVRFSADLKPDSQVTLEGVNSAKVSFDESGNLLLAGGASPALATVAPLQGPFSPMTGFVSTLAPDLSGIVFSTFAGDRHLFSVSNAAPTPDGSIAFAGSTQPTYGADAYYPFPPVNDASSSDVYVALLSPRVPSLRLDSVLNAASFDANPLAANETITLRGHGFGNDATVLLDGQALPVLLRAPGRIVAAVPSGFETDGSAHIAVQSGGARSNDVLMPVAAASPGVLSVDGSGAGQGYVLNSDGTLNGQSNPAAQGDFITVYVTGGSPDVPASVVINGFALGALGATLGTVDAFPGPVLQVRANVPVLPMGFTVPRSVPIQVVSSGVYSQRAISMWVK
jgi:uncharacterized protein (TIGR03437 family)